VRQVPRRAADHQDVETPSFTFRLERVRDIRERAEDLAREQLARELQLRLRGEAMLASAASAAGAARDTCRDAVLAERTSAQDLLAAQAYIERAERARSEAASDLHRQDIEVAARRDALAVASRERQVIDRLKERRKTEFDREQARLGQAALDEVALAVHRRGGPVSR
jgi:flagellar protein FliJ